MELETKERNHTLLTTHHYVLVIGLDGVPLDIVETWFDMARPNNFLIIP